MYRQHFNGNTLNKQYSYILLHDAGRLRAEAEILFLLLLFNIARHRLSAETINAGNSCLTFKGQGQVMASCHT